MLCVLKHIYAKCMHVFKFHIHLEFVPLKVHDSTRIENIVSRLA